VTTARHTRQLAAVLEVVGDADDHPTAEDVYTRVRCRLPRVSLGTVYRNLQKLVAQQRLRVVQLPHRAARYDSMLQPHDHFLCERCGTLTDWVREDRPQLDSSALDQAGYLVHAHSLTLYGVCPDCRAAAPHRGVGRDRRRHR